MRSGKGPSRPLRVVLDTNVLVSALFWDGNARVVQRRCGVGLLRSITSLDILEELDRVLEFKFGLPDDRRRKYLRSIAMTSEVVSIVGELKVIEDDPPDDRVLETAIVGRADAIVTGDKHLLALGSYEGIKILRAGDL